MKYISLITTLIVCLSLSCRTKRNVNTGSVKVNISQELILGKSQHKENLGDYSLITLKENPLEGNWVTYAVVNNIDNTVLIEPIKINGTVKWFDGETLTITEIKGKLENNESSGYETYYIDIASKKKFTQIK